MNCIQFMEIEINEMKSTRFWCFFISGYFLFNMFNLNQRH